MNRFHTCHGPQMRATQVTRKMVLQIVAHQLGGPPIFQLKEGRAMTIWDF